MSAAIRNHRNDRLHLDTGQRHRGRSDWRGVGSAVAVCGREVEMWHPDEWDETDPDVCGQCVKRATL